MKKRHLNTLILFTLFSGSLNTLGAQTLSDQENYIYQPQAKTPIGKPIGSASEPAAPAANPNDFIRTPSAPQPESTQHEQH